MPYQQPSDIVDRALQNVGARRTNNATTNPRGMAEGLFAYDKIRRAELERNNWTFAIRRAQLRAITSTTVTVAFPAWSATYTYWQGSVVSYNGGNWVSKKDQNLNNTPGAWPTTGTAFWDVYFGSLTADQWASASAPYSAGELAWVAPGDGTFHVFAARNTTSDDPMVADAYSSTTFYQAGSIVTASSTMYQSSAAFNVGNTPNIVVSATTWLVGTTYAINVYVVGSDGQIYQSLSNGNVGHNPVTDGAVHWNPTGLWGNTWTTTITPQPRATSNSWLWLGGSAGNAQIPYPLGSGPPWDTATKNAYFLPAGFLKMAHQDPAFAGVPRLETSGGIQASDYRIEGNYLITNQAGPLVFRFGADVQDVSKMKTMFCEALATRISMLPLAEMLTQSPQKKQSLEQDYDRFIAEARRMNELEAGSTEVPFEQWRPEMMGVPTPQPQPAPQGRPPQQ